MSLRADDIAWLGVFPPIGIARVGDAPEADDYILASETIGDMPEIRGGLRDANGAIKRQAVLFRIYARLRSGDIVEIVHGADVQIEWRVELANLKAGWYEFTVAMDVAREFVTPAARRNHDHPDRSALDIIPQPRRIAGPNAAPEVFGDGRFAGRPVPLGEIRTDEGGRLLVLGGHGRSNPIVAGTPATTFANNDGWHDDVSDGPVYASVVIGGTRFEAEPGYVAVTPPNYAPGLSGLLTMDDTVRETFMAEGWIERPAGTDFAADVWPIFARLSAMQWINQGFLVAHGTGSPLDAMNPEVAARLSDASAENRPWRERVAALFRDPAAPTNASTRQIPMIYSDVFGETSDPNLELLPVNATMFAHLRRWAAGAFTSTTAVPTLPVVFAELDPAEQVEHLRRAGLSECLGGPFHPGIELTWPLRRPELWALHHRPGGGEQLAYRLNLLPEGTAVRQDYGETLTRDVCLGPSGPTSAAGPGALTRWLGVPWQTDEASCNSAADYSPSTYLSFPSFWGTRVPEQVLTDISVERAAELPGEGQAPTLQRVKHLFQRSDWLRDVRGRRYEERINNMVNLWGTLGIVAPQPTPDALQAAGFPETLHVETGRDRRNPGSDPKVDLVRDVEALRAEEAVGALARGTAPARPPVPPRHTFRQGEV